MNENRIGQFIAELRKENNAKGFGDSITYYR